LDPLQVKQRQNIQEQGHSQDKHSAPDGAPVFMIESALSLLKICDKQIQCHIEADEQQSFKRKHGPSVSEHRLLRGNGSTPSEGRRVEHEPCESQSHQASDHVDSQQF
jgi:hypothetical protein